MLVPAAGALDSVVWRWVRVRWRPDGRGEGFDGVEGVAVVGGRGDEGVLLLLFAPVDLAAVPDEGLEEGVVLAVDLDASDCCGCDGVSAPVWTCLLPPLPDPRVLLPRRGAGLVMPRSRWILAAMLKGAASARPLRRSDGAGVLGCEVGWVVADLAGVLALGV